MATNLFRFTQMARADPKLRFTSLMGMLSEEVGLHASFERQAGKKAPGVDGMAYLTHLLQCFDPDRPWRHQERGFFAISETCSATK